MMVEKEDENQDKIAHIQCNQITYSQQIQQNLLINRYFIGMHNQSDLLSNFSEKDPKQLKQIIEALIAKSKILINNLEQTWEKLEKSQNEKAFWKDSYFNLRQSCQNYVDSSGLVPFRYIASLEDELKKEKVHKSCLQEKYKVMQPKQSKVLAREHQKKTTGTPFDNMELSEQKAELNRSNSSTLVFKETPGQLKFQNKHKIGPKSIELFKFREQNREEQH